MIDSIFLIVPAFLLAGAIKGIVGFALPIVALAILVNGFALPDAIALTLGPALFTNFWQSFTGGHFQQIVRRIWPLLLVACFSTWIGVYILSIANLTYLKLLLGFVLILYAGISMLTPQIPPPKPSLEKWLSPVFGFMGGLVLGTTGIFTVPAILYLQALGLERDVLIQAMGISFTVAMAVLGVSMTGQDMLSIELGLMSAFAVLPALIGMTIGQRVRKKVPELKFRQLFFMALFLSGLYIFFQAFSSYFH